MICVSFNSNIRLEELKKLINRKNLIELRTDLLNTKDVETILNTYKHAVLTLKNIDLEQALELINYEPKAVDIEYDDPNIVNYIEYIHKNKYNTKLIISYHNFSKTPSYENLKILVNKMKTLDIDYIKLATYINNEKDTVHLLSLLDEYENLIVVGLGKNGRFVRLMSFLLGSKLTYLTLSDRTKTAPNQYTIKEFLEYINYDFWNIDWL